MKREGLLALVGCLYLFRALIRQRDIGNQR